MGDLKDTVKQSVREAIRAKLNEEGEVGAGATTTANVDVPSTGVAKRVKRKKKEKYNSSFSLKENTSAILMQPVRKLTNKEISQHFGTIANILPIPNRVYGIVSPDGDVIGSYTYFKTTSSKLYRHPDGEDDPVHYLGDLEVDEKYRNHGIGTKLLEHFKNIKPANHDYVVITDRFSKSYPLYIRLGFVDRGESIYGRQSRILVYRRYTQ